MGKDDNRFLLVVILLAIIGAMLALIFGNDRALVALNVLLMAGLTAFTYAYMKQTKELVKEAQKQADVMADQARLARESEINSVLPLIDILADTSPSPNSAMTLKYRNVGRGPALSVRFWVDFDEGGTDPDRRSRGHFERVVPPDQAWSSYTLNTEIFNEEHKPIFPGVIRAQYEGMFGDAYTYESSLTFAANVPPILDFHKAREIVPIETIRGITDKDSRHQIYLV